eukprot:200072-Hanusia_phi.AAC.1
MGMRLFAGKIYLPPADVIIPGTRLYVSDPSSPILPGLTAIADVSQQPPQDLRRPDRLNVTLVSSFFRVQSFNQLLVRLDTGGGGVLVGKQPGVQFEVPDLDNFEAWISSLRTTSQIVFGNRWNVLLQLTQGS